MRLIGFSTGALALGDFDQALELLAGTSATAIELSALREHELPKLMGSLDRLQLDQYQYVSVHAPSRLTNMREESLVEALLPCLARGWNIVLHPDVIQVHDRWRVFGQHLCLENMDKRKATGRTLDELHKFAELLPDASFCLDLAHARQVDPTFAIARLLVATFGKTRIKQLHLSELDAGSRHAPLSMAMVAAVSDVAHWLENIPAILESRVTAAEIEKEMALAALGLQAVDQSEPRGLAWRWPVGFGAALPADPAG